MQWFCVVVLSLTLFPNLAFSFHGALTKLDKKIIGKLCEEIKEGRFDDAEQTLSNDRLYYDRILNLGTCDGLPFLHRALSVNNVKPDIIELMLHNGADISRALKKDYQKRFFNGYTPVHVAMRREHDDRVYDALKLYGGDFFARDVGGWRPVDIIFSDDNLIAITWFAAKFEIDGLVLGRKREMAHYRAVVKRALPGYSVIKLKSWKPKLKLVNNSSTH